MLLSPSTPPARHLGPERTYLVGCRVRQWVLGEHKPRTDDGPLPKGTAASVALAAVGARGGLTPPGPRPWSGLRLVRSEDERIALRASETVIPACSTGDRVEALEAGWAEVSNTEPELVSTAVSGALADLGIHTDAMREAVAARLRQGSVRR